MAPQLPQELIEQIIDLLHNCPHVLRACCLVSRSFLPRCRSYLFQNLELTDSDQALRLHAALSPDARTIIRSLALSTNSDSFLSSSTHQTWPEGLNSLYPLLQTLEQLTRLKIRLKMMACPKGIPPNIVNTLTHLETAFGRYSTYHELCSFITGFPNLATLLVILPIIDPRNSPPVIRPPYPRCAPSTLVSTDSRLLSPDTSPLDIASVHTLKATLFVVTDVHVLLNAVQTTRMCLRHLSLSLNSSAVIPAMISGTEPVVVECLQTYSLAFTIEFQRHLHLPAPKWTELLTGSVSLLERNSPHLAKTMKRVNYRHYVFEDAPSYVLSQATRWRCLDRLVEVLPELERVHIMFSFVLPMKKRARLDSTRPGVVETSLEVKNMIKVVASMMPVLAARGLLLVEACEFRTLDEEARM
ncbi:hypothetical protein CPB85DRAFT_1264814 [Mucidula mucida]|nr:hypothetical protein CPB85DRAFT_1264814 [Mucidula mucida]